MNKIAVLVAVYNGRKWVDEQLHSILNQKNVDVDIFISVDLSTDGSWEHLTDNYSKYNNVFFLPYGEKYGSAGKNFYRLVMATDFDAYEYIAFSDQDDIWKLDKLARATDTLEKSNADAYSSNVTAFWETGETQLINKSQPQAKYDYYFEAAGPGCTYVIKNELMSSFKAFLLNEENNATEFFLHDWLLYAFARVNNYNWYIDNWSSIMYRQHGNNQVGANVTIAARKKRLDLVKSKWYRNEVTLLVNLFPDKSGIGAKLKSGYAGNLKLCTQINKFRRKNFDKLFFMFVLLFNIF